MNLQENVASLLSFFLLLYLLNKSNAVVGPCLYDTNPRGIIDLTSVGRVGGTPMWKDRVPDVIDDHVYSYNPCYPFTENNCIDVAGCQTYATNDKLNYPLGPQNSIQWIPSSGDDPPAIQYTSGERTLHVNLRCLNSGEPDRLEVHGYDDIVKLYIMVLSSKCACWNGCKDGPGPGPGTSPRPDPKPNGVTGGTVFVIIFVTLIFTYLVSFMAFNKFKRQVTGIEILPHRSFWASLPGYSFDGVKFLYRKATGKSGYNSV